MMNEEKLTMQEEEQEDEITAVNER